MMRVVGIDHLSIRVSDYEKSKQFYSRLFAFLGFELSDEYEDAIGWTNGKNSLLDQPGGRRGPRAEISHRRRRLPSLCVSPS